MHENGSKLSLFRLKLSLLVECLACGSKGSVNGPLLKLFLRPRLIYRSFQLKKPHFIMSKNKNHIFFYIIFNSFSMKEISYLRMFWRGAFDAILLFDNEIIKQRRNPHSKTFFDKNFFWWKMSKKLCKKMWFFQLERTICTPEINPSIVLI